MLSVTFMQSASEGNADVELDILAMDMNAFEVRK